MHGRHSVGYEVLALLRAPFCAYPVHLLLVVPGSLHGLGKLYRYVEREGFRKGAYLTAGRQGLETRNYRNAD